MIDHDQGDEDRSEADTCPFCGRLLRAGRLWVTPLLTDREPFDPFADRVLTADDWIDTHDLFTCARDGCREQARSIQRESFKSRGRKQSDAFHANMRRRWEPVLGFKYEG